MRHLLLATLSLLGSVFAQGKAREQPADTKDVVLFQLRSELLSAFWGRDIGMSAGVVFPPDRQEHEVLPVCYSIHGFGGSHTGAWRRGPDLVEKMRTGYPRMLYVFLDATCPLGHHEFADSVNNGPWAQALTRELVPALEARFHAGGAPSARFLTGHSSGGWSSLWLMVNHPDFFGGTWSTAPDSVDFRDFTGIDVYRFENAFVDPQGAPIQLVRRGGEWVASIESFVTNELKQQRYGGQFMSFNAVFSPRGDDGQPMLLFDPRTGVIDRTVATAWQKYDIGLRVRQHWQELGPKLQGKLHVYIGTQDTFRLDGAMRLFAEDLHRLGSDATIVFAEGRDHGTLFEPEPVLWPDGMLARIHREMRAKFDAVGKPAK